MTHEQPFEPSSDLVGAEQPVFVACRAVGNTRFAAWRDVACAVFLTAGLTVGLTGVSQAYSSDKLRTAAVASGPRAVAMADDMQALLAKLAGANEATMRDKVNTFYNTKITYVDDPTLYSQADYWASPVETFARGKGDCEDYSIAKYFTLLSAGMPSSKLRMVYVKAQQGSQSVGHMVLAYYPELDQEPLILDNLIDDIRPASARTDLKPVYSFNSDGLYQGTGNQTAGDPMVRISKWRDAVEKVRAEGF
jgi:predicted transglutaminase-like cysteine proteinase